MKEIQLKQGKVAIVDDEDFERLNQHKYSLYKMGNTYYAFRFITVRDRNKKENIKRKRKAVSIHQEVVEKSLKTGEEIHHINGNGLDNQKCNLQIVTISQHRMTREKRKNCTSQYKGVYWYKAYQKWSVQIMINSKATFLGYYDNEIEAAKIYDETAKKLFGEFAWLNFKE